MSRQSLLDANIVSYLVDPESIHFAKVLARFELLECKPGVSVVTAYEVAVYQAVRKAVSPAVETWMSRFDIIAAPQEPRDVHLFAEQKTRLAAERGARISALARQILDLFLAVTTISQGMTLVTADTLLVDLAAWEPRLTVEDWTR